MLEFLKKLPPFEDMTAGKRLGLLYEMKRKNIKRGEYLLKEGHKLEQIFIVYEGSFVMEKQLITPNSKSFSKEMEE